MRSTPARLLLSGLGLAAATAVATVATALPGTTATAVEAAHAARSVPKVTSVSPASGSTFGGNTITITGSGFTRVSNVVFSGDRFTDVAPDFTVDSATSITATVPATTEEGTVDVLVVVRDSPSRANANDRYTYRYPRPAPVVTSVSPGSGPLHGGDTVTIAGSGFADLSDVRFIPHGRGEEYGALAPSVSIDSDTSLTVTVPDLSFRGAADVVVYVENDRIHSALTKKDRYVFRYDGPVPTVTGVSPGSGPVGGGNTVTISGTGFDENSIVHIGRQYAESITVSDSSITATVPDGFGESGRVDVLVYIGGTNIHSKATQPARYTYRDRAPASPAR